MLRPRISRHHLRWWECAPQYAPVWQVFGYGPDRTIGESTVLNGRVVEAGPPSLAVSFLSFHFDEFRHIRGAQQPFVKPQGLIGANLPGVLGANQVFATRPHSAQIE